MSSRKLAETTVTLIVNELKASLPTALSELRTERADPAVSTEQPKSYLIYSGAIGYITPAVFVICEEMEMMNAERGSNFINAKARILASVLVEDRVADRVVKKAWRYQAAMHKVLHETVLTTGDGKVRIVIKVDRIRFSPEFSDTKDPNAPQSVFRKEVVLDLEVEHWEALAT